MNILFEAHYYNVIIKRIQQSIWKVINYFYARLWKIQINYSCNFQGLTHFHRLPNSKIIIGKNCTFNSSPTSNLIGIYNPCMISTIKQKAEIRIGDNCGFSGTVIASALKITIGNNVRCGANTLITDSDWHTDDYRSRSNKEIIIEDNVWLGYGVKVLKGVHIGENTLIGACSIVTHNIPANVIAAGNPCKIIQKIDCI